MQFFNTPVASPVRSRAILVIFAAVIPNMKRIARAPLIAFDIEIPMSRHKTVTKLYAFVLEYNYPFLGKSRSMGYL